MSAKFEQDPITGDASARVDWKLNRQEKQGLGLWAAGGLLELATTHPILDTAGLVLMASGVVRIVQGTVQEIREGRVFREQIMQWRSDSK